MPKLRYTVGPKLIGQRHAFLQCITGMYHTCTTGDRERLLMLLLLLLRSSPVRLIQRQYGRDNSRHTLASINTTARGIEALKQQQQQPQPSSHTASFCCQSIGLYRRLTPIYRGSVESYHIKEWQIIAPKRHNNDNNSTMCI